jgi:hypothetical protein
MKERVPTLQNFKEGIENLFGQALNEPASEAAQDFWNHWTLFTSAIGTRSLSIQVDPFFLGHHFPQYKRYHVWKGSGKVLALLGIIVVWFFWQVGIAILLVGVGLHSVGNGIRFRDAKGFADGLLIEAEANATRGYPAICANYIAGIIQLVSPQGSARWPQCPSNSVTGQSSLIESARSRS